MRAFRIVVLLLIYLWCTSLNATVANRNILLTPQADKTVPATISQRYIPASVKKANRKKAELRLKDWKTFINTNQGKPAQELIVLVNSYFNNMGFIDDRDLWQSSDYWATPYEVLSKGAGDCEDHAIAKYYTLRNLGIPENQLQIAFVRVSLQKRLTNTNYVDHMVLLYSPGQQGRKLVLDNLTSEITSISESGYYELGYSFNTHGVWVWKDNTQSIAYGGPDVIKNWRLLRQRFARQVAELKY